MGVSQSSQCKACEARKNAILDENERLYKARVHHIFELADENKDGYIYKENLKHYFQRIQERLFSMKWKNRQPEKPKKRKRP